MLLHIEHKIHCCHAVDFVPIYITSAKHVSVVKLNK